MKNTHLDKPIQTIYNCELCTKVYKTKKSLNQHVQFKHPSGNQTIYKCHACKALFDKEESLDKHIEICKSRSRKSVCPFCRKIVNDRSTHIKKEHPEETLETNVCQELLGDFSMPEEHQTPLECNTIGKWKLENISKNLLRSFNMNDLTDIEWHKEGKPIGTEGPTRVSPISCDNFIVRIPIPDEEIVNKRCITVGTYHRLLHDWLNGNEIIHAGIKNVAANLVAQYLDFKVALPDVQLDKVLTILNNTDMIEKHGFKFLDIDIKADYACTVNAPAIHDYIAQNYPVANISYDDSKEKRVEPADGSYYKVNNDSMVGRNCPTYLVPYWGGFIRAKIYNKFECSLESAGCQEIIGDSIVKWMYSNGENLNHAIASDEAQANGLSRIEFTLYDEVPSVEDAAQLIGHLQQMFLPECVSKPINDQWKMIDPYLKHTLVIYNCFTGDYVLSRWGANLQNRYNGTHSKPSYQNATTFMQIISLCSLSNVPIDIVMISCNAETKTRYSEIPMDFARLVDTTDEYNFGDEPIVNLNKWRYGVVSLCKYGEDTSTLFIKSNSIYTKLEEQAGLYFSLLPNILSCQPRLPTSYFGRSSNFNTTKLRMLNYTTDIYKEWFSNHDMKTIDAMREKLCIEERLVDDDEEDEPTLYTSKPTRKGIPKNMIALYKVEDVAVKVYTIEAYWIVNHRGKKTTVLALDVDKDSCYRAPESFDPYMLDISLSTTWQFKIMGSSYDNNRNKVVVIEKHD
jgi:hypothetical protein